MTLAVVESRKDLKARRSSLRADLYMRCSQMSVHQVESLCRRIHAVELKMLSFRASNYDKE